ncbi:porphobilinogen synthase [Bacilli bacterium PM5-3]|nr:porphobilinogen synthase [Bacilli bacterium PM5-3]MDH6603974.1 porphobilinogen synthase [Bacilli bacterium PM5-9]
MFKRYKKTRINQSMRDLVRDVYLSKEDLIYPVFVVEGENIYQEISTLPNQYHYSIDKLPILLKKLKKANIDKIILFGLPKEKDECGKQAYNPNGVIQEAIRFIKKEAPDIFVITDVCLCEYTSHGHCGILEDEVINNDLTLEYLNKIALSHVKAGADMVAPSDMNDGRIKSIRHALDKENYHYIPIMSYGAKYASSFYGPFREAACSAPQFGDRKYYQMDYRNTKLAIDEVLNDIDEGADIVIVKPALAYLDIVQKIRDKTNLGLAVYNVSGEYAMVKAASQQDLIDEKGTVLEMMYSFKRAGANMIITYHALDVAGWLDE